MKKCMGELPRKRGMYIVSTVEIAGDFAEKNVWVDFMSIPGAKRS
jgi:hypothetical protein